MNYLWENPKIVSFLLINSNKEDVKNYIAPLIGNNFYENTLSSNYIEDHLLYVIGLLLKNEIDNDINNKRDCVNFLEDTPCGILLEQLKTKQDVQTYFKTIIFKIVEQLEEESSAYEINFNLQSIQEEFNKTKEEIEAEYKKTGKKQKNITVNYFKKNNNDDYESKNENNEEKSKENEIYNKKYMFNLDKEEYTKLINKNEKNKIMSDFLLSQYKKVLENPNIFSNEAYFNNVLKLSASNEILASYQIDFTKTIKIIDEFLNILLKNLYLLPYSVKCICKIIVLMIRKKFPDLSIANQNAFIAKFFFHKLFGPIFENPGIGALINNFIISGVTHHNLKIISSIIKQLFSGKFFVDKYACGGYTPFNWYFIDSINYVYQFFDNVIQVTLPPFMEKLINNELPKSYEYNYFKENPEEGIFHRSICFSFKDLCAILNNMKELKDKIFVGPEYQPFKKTFEKLVNKSGTQEIEKIKKNIEYEMVKIYDPKKKKEPKEVKGNPILKFFLISQLLTNQKYTKIFSINQEKASFTLPEIPCISDEDNPKNNVIKVKNFICTLLNNYRTLVKADFIEGTTNNTVSILNQLKNFMKISNFVVDGSIPSEWYVDSLLEYLKNIPNELTSNDNDLLYKQLESHINVSIKDIDFELLSVVLGNVKFCKRGQNFYEKMKTHLIDIELNEKVQSIVEKEPIAVELEFKYTQKIKELKIEKSSKKDIQLRSLDNMMFEEETQKTYYCRTIKAFTKRFPNIAKIQKFIEKDLSDMEKELKLTQKISNYFNIIKEFLSSKNSTIYNLIGTEEFNDISAKIYDYVMEKLYDKLFPRKPDPLDKIILEQCQILSWTEPKHYIKSKINLVFDSFLPDVIYCFKEIDQQKSPRQKLIYMNKIFLSISNVVKFSGGGNTGVDDIMPILNYAFIKAKPPHISSNCKYMELFLGEKKNREEGNQLAQLTAICEFAASITADKLFNITSEQFNKKCMAVKQLLN